MPSSGALKSVTSLAVDIIIIVLRDAFQNRVTSSVVVFFFLCAIINALGDLFLIDR